MRVGPELTSQQGEYYRLSATEVLETAINLAVADHTLLKNHEGLTADDIATTRAALYENVFSSLDSIQPHIIAAAFRDAATAIQQPGDAAAEVVEKVFRDMVEALGVTTDIQPSRTLMSRAGGMLDNITPLSAKKVIRGAAVAAMATTIALSGTTHAAAEPITDTDPLAYSDDGISLLDNDVTANGILAEQQPATPTTEDGNPSQDETPGDTTPEPPTEDQEVAEETVVTPTELESSIVAIFEPEPAQEPELTPNIVTPPAETQTIPAETPDSSATELVTEDTSVTEEATEAPTELESSLNTLLEPEPMPETPEISPTTIESSLGNLFEPEPPSITLQTPEEYVELANKAAEKILADMLKDKGEAAQQGMEQLENDLGEIGATLTYLDVFAGMKDYQPKSRQDSDSTKKKQKKTTDTPATPATETVDKDTESSTTTTSKKTVLDVINDIENDGANWKNRAYVIERFVKAGYTVENGMAFAGRFVIESGGDKLDPTVKQWHGGPGRGVAQWGNSGTSERAQQLDRFGFYRQANGKYRSGTLRWFAEKTGQKWDSIECQVDFVLWELENTEKGAAKALKNAGHNIKKSAIASLMYERPASWLAKGESREKAIKETLGEAKEIQKLYNKKLGKLSQGKPKKSTKPSHRITKKALNKLEKTVASSKVQSAIIKVVNSAIISSDRYDYPVSKFSKLSPDPEMKKILKKAGYKTSKEAREIYDCLKVVTAWFDVNNIDFNTKRRSTTDLSAQYNKGRNATITDGDSTFKIIRNPKISDLVMGDVLLQPGHALLVTGNIKGKGGEIYGAIEAAYASNRVASFRHLSQVYDYMSQKNFIALRLIDTK